MAETIKPCPFCGSPATFNGESYDYGGQVECAKTECQAIGPFRDDKTSAITVWNARNGQ